jgi:AcrR family transcriptional regulator
MDDARSAAAAGRGDRSRRVVLAAATRALVDDPKATLSEVAEAIGIGRTTLHRMFPTRRDLLLALAHDALRHLADVYAEAGLSPRDEPPGESSQGLRRLIDLMIPLGPSLMFLLRAQELDGDDHLEARVAELDQPVRDAVGRAQANGSVDAAIPDWWAVETLFAGIYLAWEQIEAGRLAPRDAGALVHRTWLCGIGPAAH